MRRIITALLVLLTTSAIAQNGGQITGKKNSGLTGTVMVDSVALKVSDSASRVYLSAMKLKSDSIYKRMYQDSVNLAKLGTGVITTLDSATQRSTIKVSGHDSTTDSRLGVKLLVNPTITNDSSTLSRTTIKVSNFPATQPVSGSVTATLDSATQRTTIKVSNFPTTQAVSGTFWQTTQPVSGTITTSPPSNASSNISQINGITPLMGNGVTGTGSQRVTIASDNTAFSVNTIASASDSTKYRSTIQVSNFPASQSVTFTRLKATTDTLVASLDATDSTNIAGINSKLSGTLTVGSHAVTNAGTFAVQATQSGTWNITNVSGTVSLPTGASTETTLSALNSKVPSGLSTAGSRLAIYSPDSIRVFATNGFGSGGSGGTTSLDAVDSTNLANTATNTSNTNSKLPSGLTVTSTRLLVDGSGVTQPVSVSGNVNTTISGVTKKTLGTAVVSADTGLVINAVMHGLTTGGGGGYVDVKVNPSGALTVEATQSGTWNVNNTPSASDSSKYRSTIQVSNFPATQAVSFTRLKASTDTVAISGSITATAGATASYDSTWTAVQMDTIGLGAKASSATVGWQSDSVGLRQHKCTDVKIGVKISMANTAPANDKAVYVYVYPIWYNGSTWYFASGGTTTLPSGANSTYTIASPNNLRLLGVLSYTTTNMVLQDQFILSNAFGSTMPDAFGLVIVNFSGAAIHTTDHRIYYSLINKVQR